jgi:hypothetical protein
MPKGADDLLAYVFWHWKSESVPLDRYEQMARAFYASLETAPPPGFTQVTAYAVEKAPWIPGGRLAYEEWYGVTGSAALDPLNDAAVSPPHQAAHDPIARAAEGGAGGLYRLRRGTPLRAQARYAHWFAKPAGMAYADLYALLEPLTAHAALWGRQMVLGPTAEFCLHTRQPTALPPPLTPTTLPLRVLWPAGPG